MRKEPVQSQAQDLLTSTSTQSAAGKHPTGLKLYPDSNQVVSRLAGPIRTQRDQQKAIRATPEQHPTCCQALSSVRSGGLPSRPAISSKWCCAKSSKRRVVQTPLVQQALCVIQPAPLQMALGKQYGLNCVAPPSVLPTDRHTEEGYRVGRSSWLLSSECARHPPARHLR